MNLRYALFLPLISFAIIISVYAVKKNGDDDFEKSRETIVMREIGHKLLLAAGDHSTRVLPVRKVSSRRYEIRFEKEFSPVPDSFVAIINRNLRSRLNETNYTANLISCEEGEVVYGFVSSSDSTVTIVPCLQRPIPKGCYSAEIIWDNLGTGILQSGLYILAFILTLILVSLLIWVKTRKKYTAQVPTTEASEKMPAGDIITIGDYHFHFREQYLLIDAHRTDLTTKEADLLFILASHPNQIIERGQLQKLLWENEGVIVTRSLDMFVSRLRKKLTGDPTIKIVNVHKRGYKLQVPGS